jgi:hypothetical protein
MQTCFSWLKIYVLFHSPSTVSVLCRREMEPQEKLRKVNTKNIPDPTSLSCYLLNKPIRRIDIRQVPTTGWPTVRRTICTISLVTHTCCKSNFAKSWLHSILSDNRIHEHVGSVEVLLQIALSILAARLAACLFHQRSRHFCDRKLE